MNKKRYVILIVFLVILQIGILFFFLSKRETISDYDGAVYFSKNENKRNAELAIHSSYFSSKDFYEEAYSEMGKEYKNAFYDEKVYGGIVPHHLIVKNYIASFFSQLEKQGYETIVLIGPNHFEIGENKVSISLARWQTPYGEIKPNLNLAEKIIEDKKIVVDEEPFYREHSISGLVPFIKKSLPNVTILPMVLSSDLSEEEAIEIAEILFQNIDREKTLVLSSVDFSHYLPADVADFHDARSNGVIKSFDMERIYSLEIDSPPAIFVLLKYLELSGAKKSKLLWHTNSGLMDLSQPSTTHNFFYFSEGKSLEENVVSMMFFGDMMLDRYIGEIVEKKGMDFLFENIKHEENRFFRGLDIIGANLEGAVTNEGEHYNPALLYDFAFSPKDIENVKKYNFNFFNLANNHFSDQGDAGMQETRDNLDKQNIIYSGCRDKEVSQDCTVKNENIGGINIAFVGLSMVYGVFDLDRAKELISDAASTTDFVLVNIHWGQEYTHFYNSVQKEFAYGLIDSGADVIIGHHPHVTQGIEIYKNKPIFYSLGNFVFDQPVPTFPKDNSEGFALGVILKDSVASYKIFPYTMEKFQLRLLDNDKKKIFLEEIVSWSKLNEEIEKNIVEGRLY